ncbi:hypothetical protein FHW67_002436 [Herbaspirillum sp. Sphag1AN]|uniref:hypothetical protein n=1 Tax=unclassified Herbaspirillum TaxID=2624150 RepID=UPI00181557B5|nr:MULTISPECIES: hypothetical protein [unclassified Herbaspirillum]MBB3213147.1 hypothetical protein [Herbaspirillum sp. Sphag1AN]MBB3246344.1 hypothetical protein [Herbaspirillum sp. Sphag64]
MNKKCNHCFHMIQAMHVTIAKHDGNIYIVYIIISGAIMATSKAATPTTTSLKKAVAKTVTKAPAKVATKVATKPVTKKPVAASKVTAPAKASTTKKVLAKTTPAALKKSLPAAVKPALKQVTKPAAKAVAPLKAEKKTELKLKKVKQVRDSFTMPETEYAVLSQVKKNCLKVGFEIKKSDLLRIGVSLIKKLETGQLKTLLAGLTPLKVGRPKK